MSKLELKVPEYDELNYRQKLLADPKTMEHNAGYNALVKGYNYDTGTISFTKDKWEKFYNAIKDSKTRYFAYIIDTETNEKVGYVQFSYKPQNYHYSCGILIEASKRGKGYSKEALKLMLDKAFYEYNVPSLWYDVPESRKILITMLHRVGFDMSGANYVSPRFGKDELMYQMYVTKEMYEAKQKENDNQ